MRTLRPKLGGGGSTVGGLYIRVRIAQCSLEDSTLWGLYTLNSRRALHLRDSALGSGGVNGPSPAKLFRRIRFFFGGFEQQPTCGISGRNRGDS